ncbi:MAG: hypothetical protein E7397_07825 [Ruminococcaceae bacterium]|nr:hypothetical protein [Oscillospiraceae bacterium]
MRILDEDRDTTVDNVLILFTKEEAIQLISSLEDLIADETKGNHHHINNNDYSKELTIALYNEKNIDDWFSERCKRLIQYDK